MLLVVKLEVKVIELLVVIFILVLTGELLVHTGLPFQVEELVVFLVRWRLVEIDVEFLDWRRRRWSILILNMLYMSLGLRYSRDGLPAVI